MTDQTHGPLREAIRQTHARIAAEQEILRAQEAQLEKALGPKLYAVELAQQFVELTHSAALQAETRLQAAIAAARGDA